MGLMSFFKRQSDAAPAAGAAPTDVDSVSQARVRARRRLIGAVVLVAAGVIGFPLLFETQPRPIPIDIPIEIPRKDGSTTLSLPQAPAAVVLDSADGASPSAPTPSGSKLSGQVARADSADKDNGGAVITEAAEDAGREVPAPKTASLAAKPAASPASKPTPAKPAASKPAATKPAEPSKPNAAEAARAKALLEGKQAAKDNGKDNKDGKDSAKDTGRFVIQVGAFADNAAAHAVRLKVERLGMKTYTQVAQTPDGPRIRVRVGPFGTRGDAEKAQSKAKSAGLPAALLTL